MKKDGLSLYMYYGSTTCFVYIIYIYNVLFVSCFPRYAVEGPVGAVFTVLRLFGVRLWWVPEWIP